MDYAALFSAIPTPYLVMTPDLVIVEVNEAYLRVSGRSRPELVGRPVFEVFPPAPDALDDSGVSRVQLSFERVRDTGLADTMPLQRYDIPDPESGEYEERYWSLMSVPVLDDAGRTVLIMQRVEDVTDYVRERDRNASERAQGEAWRRRGEEAEAGLFARGQELQAAVEAKEKVGRRLAGLAEVALQLSSAQSVDDLTEIVIRRGLAALGADGGAVAVREDAGRLRLTMTSSLGPRAQAGYGELPLDGPLPASVAAATGRRVLLPDREACLEWAPEMADVVSDTGCQAWACLPLHSGDRLLGSLSVGWAQAQAFPDAEAGLLDALAAQCAQGLERIQTREAERRSAAAARRMSETLQRSMLPRLRQPHGLDVAVRYRPAAQEAQVGGDWYDTFATPDGEECLVIGDVAGHDREAAAAMGQVRNLLRGVAYTLVESPAAVLTLLDRALHDLQVGSLATAVLAKVRPSPTGSADAERGLLRLRWSNAGHPPPLLVHLDGSARLLSTEADLMLGLDADTPRADHELLLEPGSTLLLYTDGLVERRSSSIDDGLDWLMSAAGRLSGLSLDAVCDALLEQVGQRGDDDVALVAVRCRLPPS